MEQTANPQKKKHLVFWIVFPIGMLLITAILVFYFDLANGPWWWMLIEALILGAFVTIRILFRDKKFWMRLITWAGFISLTIGVVALNKPTIERKSIVYHSGKIERTEVLQLNQGKIKGVYNKDKTVEMYGGIPYAKAERWKEPHEYTWDNVIDGYWFGPRSMQSDRNPIINSAIDMYSEKGWHPNFKMKPIQNMSEDGLYLNIWKPNTTETNLPILVYIHGGSLTTGDSSNEDINGEATAKKGVIMITIQYRLGVFGYFAHPDLKQEALEETGHATTGNYGLLDQVYALKWINENASNFGGDKNNITIAGESAGSSSVSALCVTPLASGLFKRAIGDSSSLVIKKVPHTYRTQEVAYNTSSKVLKEFNCKDIAALRKIPADKLVKTQYENSGMMMDGYALPKDPYQIYLDGNNNEEALLNGYNVKEADPFVIPLHLFDPTNASNINARLKETFGNVYGQKIYDLYKEKIKKDAFSVYNEVFSVYWFIMPHHSWSNAALNNGVDVYRYQFTKENGYYSTYHAGELIYAYGNIGRNGHDFAYNKSDRELSEIMNSYWTNFAKTGNPNGEGLPTWEKYSNSTDGVQELGKSVGKIEDKYLALYDILQEFIDNN